MVEIECLWECDDGLGETPIWVAEESSIYWADHVGPSIDPTDTRTPSLRRLNIATGARKTWQMPEQIGSFGFRVGGGLVCGANSGFCTIDLDTGAFEKVFDPEPRMPSTRLNDGKIDRRGRFWCGSMDSSLTDACCHIYCLDPDLTCRKAAEDYSFIVSNGIAFDPEDTRMYFGDTFGGMIYVFDFDIDEGRVHNRRPFFSVEDRKPAIVDGATVDAEGYYWFALNLGGKILRVDPKGRLDREIDMPVRSPTCVAFGGDNYETLFVTSQQAFLTPEELAHHPLPGSLFAIHGLGVRGLPEPQFGA
ncbi:SMP-30/gluconolactonase/LRE family protein [Ruegeria sp. 2205SS24-7]|uniref:SMP-30/gluconolactonase/LRE family protein n=1 Tax=Ruegeria discodermiae TaxID=3064389 RepID=UPI0027425A25|nr:SMP-30/gluconolactonase/LRE family protein [Ruegeria sp. 2205SS24-7]MDP5216396.1 SMP-30/gluconolactonase/LRE family protein [Ruegeria sp. 2205SS24-7]